MTIGHVFSIGKETTDKVSGQFVNAVLRVLRLRAIDYPAINDIALWDGIEESSEQQQGIPRIVGAINGTHIPIAIWPGDEWKGYIN
ncbi:hypothetical protein PSTG_17008 [Puccinia striiformis f. sp. tritici PST-78]|uniref:DDE Tnp4 domain-containing protein n=1 Tax=Puccinia striiformis f. sp. tritici PST-78 TaxID=1165861 RepID=A0A0L0URL9_9BASI|nr:hypothetical protein PSTG_17008 [Puccinia striiformis f. sp. tritici PST-78]